MGYHLSAIIPILNVILACMINFLTDFIILHILMKIVYCIVSHVLYFLM